jgi:hypothetical protein
MGDKRQSFFWVFADAEMSDLTFNWGFLEGGDGRRFVILGFAVSLLRSLIALVGASWGWDMGSCFMAKTKCGILDVGSSEPLRSLIWIR